jgi:hypothetical protein
MQQCQFLKWFGMATSFFKEIFKEFSADELKITLTE